MDFLEILKTRRSIREFSDKEIPKEILEKIVDSARFAPTARNVQPWEFVVIIQAPILKKLSELAENGRFLAQAKACIAVFCADTKYYLEDGCATTCNILLAAASLGVGSCWVAGDKKPYCAEVAHLLNVPIAYKLVSLIALGYPKSKDSFHAAEKRSLKEIIHWEKFTKRENR
ncbi:MAG: nitroreductase family protein [Candidatus Omnitrophica bacterium]|jgi:nitroreductase|nr:nitroreductase family protein [Candidatus Omnitrophota bacterium]